MRYVLGINAYDHDVAACLVRDGEIVTAINKERITRVKHDSGFYRDVVDYCLAAAGLDLARPDRVVLNSYLLPVPELENRLLASRIGYYLDDREREIALAHPYFRAAGDRFAVCSHHLAHAYSGFAVSPFERGAIMVVDGIGSCRGDVTEAFPSADETHPAAREAESYYTFNGPDIWTVKKVFMGPVRGLVNDEFEVLPGLGALYSRVSTYIFGHWNKCGEVMGLAPFGLPDAPRMAEVAGGETRIRPWPAGAVHPFPGGSDEDWNGSPHCGDWADLAFRVQDDVEEALIARARWLHEETGETNLVLAGGVALNCVANGRILEETPFEKVFIQPAAGDDGIAIGCAMYGHLALLGGERPAPMRSAALGREYGEEDVEEALRPLAVRLMTRVRAVEDMADEAARLIAEGKIVGWFSGRSEFGPRALGHRSMLADPRDPKVKDKVNARIKHRQAFRPFAPAVLAERANEYFLGEAESPFMLLVKRVRPEKKDEIPSVLHIDDTARVQTVRKEDDPVFHALISAFERRTGVPVVLNTSFNDRDEPIVETPGDAVTCFLNVGLDALAIGNRIVTKAGLHRLAKPFLKTVTRVRSGMISDRFRARLGQALLDEA